MIMGQVIYVDVAAPGANNGSSWTDAYTTVSGALNDPTLASVGEIWVAAGTYRPDPAGLADAREANFQLVNSVAIYGGLAGTENPATFDLSSRDFVANETILSGDLNGDDQQGLDPCDLLNHASRTDNCYHVFYHASGVNLNSSAILDGFTITAANANGVSQHYMGGACSMTALRLR